MYWTTSTVLNRLECLSLIGSNADSEGFNINLISMGLKCLNRIRHRLCYINLFCYANFCVVLDKIFWRVQWKSLVRLRLFIEEIWSLLKSRKSSVCHYQWFSMKLGPSNSMTINVVLGEKTCSVWVNLFHTFVYEVWKSEFCMSMSYHIRQPVVEKFFSATSYLPGKWQKLAFFCFHLVTNTH